LHFIRSVTEPNIGGRRCQFKQVFRHRRALYMHCDHSKDMNAGVPQ
jgi:hypothetical protein